MNTNTRLASYLSAGLKVLLVGPPGCAKTARVLAAAQAQGYRVIVLRASLLERCDVGGIIAPNFEKGIAEILPLDVLRDLRTAEVPTLVFLDDLGQAPIDVQAALMRYFDEGFLSPYVTIWAATNRPGDKAGVLPLCEPLRSRFDVAFNVATPGAEETATGGSVLSTWEEEVAGWVDWAMDADAPPEVIAWHRNTTGRTLYQWKSNADPSVRMADFRTWGSVIKAWNAGLQDTKTICGIVGKAVGIEFLAFARLADGLPSPDQVWMDPDGAIVPTEPAQLYLISSMLASAAQPEHAKALVTYLARLPRVYGALLAKDAHRRLASKLGGIPEWVRWFKANQELFLDRA